MQISAHRDAVDLFERYASGCDNSELKAWAGKTLPALKHHLEMAQQPDQKTWSISTRLPKNGAQRRRVGLGRPAANDRFF
jgi:hypothetical protein